jgi:hypothetical protein
MIQIKKEEVKLFLFADDILLDLKYRENSYASQTPLAK